LLLSVNNPHHGIFRNLLEVPEALIGPLKDQPPQPIKPDEGKKQ
jgi:hypothetical protein